MQPHENGGGSRMGAIAYPTVAAWHDKTDQILVGGSQGNIRVFFDPELSSKGVMLAVDSKELMKEMLSGQDGFGGDAGRAKTLERRRRGKRKRKGTGYSVA